MRVDSTLDGAASVVGGCKAGRGPHRDTPFPTMNPRTILATARPRLGLARPPGRAGADGARRLTPRPLGARRRGVHDGEPAPRDSRERTTLYVRCFARPAIFRCALPALPMTIPKRHLRTSARWSDHPRRGPAVQRLRYPHPSASGCAGAGLRGDFIFDACRPMAAHVPLNSPRARQTRTRARLALRSRLLAKPIVDPREPPDEMNGIPITRESSPNGRWAYTLYDGAEHPFVHALDTKRRRAVCVDLHGLDERRNGVVGV